MIDKEFISNIRQSIKANNIKAVEELIGNSKEKLNTVFVFGSWLHEAAELGYIELAGKLLDMGIDTTLVAPSYKGSALSSAASEGQTEMIKFLLSRGMKFDVSNSDANPLFCAISNQHSDTVRFLIELEVDVSINYANKNDQPWTALELAEQYDNNEIINMIKGALNKNDKRVGII